MKTLKKNWAGLAGAMSLGTLAACAVYACVSAWAQTGPGLSIASTGTNKVRVSITNGASNGLYQIYYREFLSTNYPWLYFTNGSVGQTDFVANLGDTTSGFFQASYNTNFVVPTITVIIQSPTNGALTTYENTHPPEAVGRAVPFNPCSCLVVDFSVCSPSHHEHYQRLAVGIAKRCCRGRTCEPAI